MEFEFKVENRNTGAKSTVVWNGATWQAAAAALVDCKPELVVYAWRSYPRTGVFVGDARRIVEPGQPGW